MHKRTRLIGMIVMSTLICVCAIRVAAQEKPLDNADIVKLTKLDMGDNVIIAKIKSAKDVSFATSTDDLVKLRESGVSKDVIAAMLDRGAAGSASAGKSGGVSGGEPRVTLQTVAGPIELQSVFGVLKVTSSFFGLARWVQFEDLVAKTRTRDSKPSVLVESEKDPRGAWWFVSLSQQKKGENYRYFDLEGGGPFGAYSGSPEKGSIVKVDSVETKPGVWRLTPQKELKPGEYGLYSGRREGEGILFGFGIDK